MIPTKENTEIIRKTINEFWLLKGFENRRIVIFGCTLYACDIIQCLKEINIEVFAFIDNDNSKVDSFCSGIKVYNPAWVTTVDRAIVIIASHNYGREMKGQMINLGLKTNQILEIPVKNPLLPQVISDEERFKIKLEDAQRGLQKYKELIEEDTDLLIVFPYPGTGDIYLACGFLKLYLSQKTYQNPKLVVSKESCKKVARLFDYTNVSIVSQTDLENVLLIWQLLGSDVIKVKPVLFWGWNTKYYFRDYRKQGKMSFIDYFKYDVFDLNEEDQFEPPIKKNHDNEIARLFEKYGLINKKTVIIAPYAGSFVSSIPMNVWEQVAAMLRTKGYKVCTNCYGDEVPIKGTTPFRFDYDIAVNVIEEAGNFIAIRSGLCDIVSSASAKMLIIYESNYPASDIECFGIKKMGLNNTVSEIDYCGSETFLNTIEIMY